MTVLKLGPNKRQILYTCQGYLSQSRNTRQDSNYRSVPLTPTHPVELISILCTCKHSVSVSRVRNVEAKSIRCDLEAKGSRVHGEDFQGSSCKALLVGHLSILTGFCSMYVLPLS